MQEFLCILFIFLALACIPSVLVITWVILNQSQKDFPDDDDEAMYD
jgi:hypothetical protein